MGGKFKGFRGNKEVGIERWVCSALIWLLGQPGGRDIYASWVELYAAFMGIDPSKAHPDEVQARLRSRGYLVKRELDKLGLGCVPHPKDRSMIRATAHGKDSAQNWEPRERRRVFGGVERYRAGVASKIGDPRKLSTTSVEEKRHFNTIAAFMDKTTPLGPLIEALDLPGLRKKKKSGQRKAAA